MAPDANKTTAAASAEDAPPKLSKSQKKRRKRKNAKEASEANKQQPAAAAAVPSISLNPASQLHAQLMAQGFEAKEIDVALEEMWDKEMRYDEFDAVLAYLESKRNGTSVEEPETVSYTNGHHHHREEAVEEEKDETLEKEESHSKPAPPPEQQPPIDIAERLNQVSDNANLADAAFALKEWITRAASTEELVNFCVEKKSRALSTVIQRAIMEPRENGEDSSLAAVLGLVASIFLKAGMDSNSIADMKSNLRLVLQQAKTAYNKNKDHDESFAERVTTIIVTRISGLVQDLLDRANDDSQKSIPQLEEEIDALSTSLNSFGQGGIVELIQNRDMQKLATQKSSQVVNIAMGAAGTNGLAPPTSASMERTRVTKDQVLLSIVGEDGLDEMKRNKDAHDEVRQKVKAAESRTSPEYQALKLNLNTFQGEQSIVQQKMEELKNALRKLLDEDAMLSNKIQAAQDEIALLDESSNGEVAKLQGELSETSKKVECDASIRTLADRMAVYESSVKQSFASIPTTATLESKDVGVVPSKIGLYLIRARNYFRSEADCVQYLRARVKTIETEANNLRNEYEEFSALGLSTNATQVSDALSKKLDNIADDNRAIEALSGEASKMREELSEKLEMFIATYGPLSSLHVTILRGIESSIQEIGLAGGLEPYTGVSAMQQQPSPVASAVNGSHAPVMQQNAAPAAVAPKLTWANKPDTQVKKTEVQSLASIQKEEMSKD